MPEASWGVCSVTFDKPKRGPGDQTFLQAQARSATITWGWGAQPSRATLAFVASDTEKWPPITAGAYTEIKLFGKTFYGLARSGPATDNAGEVLPMVKSSSGRTVTIEFEDTRRYLYADSVFCAFNKVETRMVGTKRVRRYWHIYPSRFKPYVKTYSDAPLTAANMLDLIFAAFTTQIAWQRAYHADQILYPVHDVDALAGKSLAELVNEISEAQALTFTLAGGPFRLVWSRKGEGQLPAVPVASDDQTLSLALSGHSTRVHVIGDRNVYLVLDVPMIADWNRHWEEFWDLEKFTADLFQRARDPASNQPFNNYPGDVEQQIGWQLAAARAREITVAEYAALRLDKDFRDFRLYAGRSRMNLPAWIYMTDLMFRAFRPPPALTVNGITGATDAMEIVDTLPARVTHDPVKGTMAADLTDTPEGNGYCIVQGYNVGSDLFRTVNPERFRFDQWVANQDLWQAVPFQIDQSAETGRFIILESWVFRSRNFVHTENGLAALNAPATLEVPPVRCALAFEWDKYTLTLGPGSWDEHVNVPGLRAEYIVDPKAAQVVEVPYADGMMADAKAAQVAAPILSRPFRYYQGSYRWKLNPDDVIPELSGLMARITLEYSDAGHVCVIEWTNERGERFFPQLRERDFTRLLRQQSSVPGQAELRAEARQFRLIAGGLKALGPAWARELAWTFRGRFGSDEATYAALANGSGLLELGTPLWKQPSANGAQTRAVMPPSATASHSVFAGVTTRQHEDAARPLYLQKTGEILARVRGPVSAGEIVAQSAGNDFLAGKASAAATAPEVGKAQWPLAEGVTALIPVLVGAGGGTVAAGGPARWA